MAVRVWELSGSRKLAPGANEITFSVMHATAYKATNGDTLVVNSAGWFPNKIFSVEFLNHPASTALRHLFGEATLRTGFKSTNVRVKLFGNASTTSGKGKGFRLVCATGTNMSAVKSRIRVRGY